MSLKKPVFVLLIQDEEPKYFQSLEKVSNYFEMSGYEEGTILEVTSVIDIAVPPEPETELTDREMKDIEFTK